MKWCAFSRSSWVFIFTSRSSSISKRWKVEGKLRCKLCCNRSQTHLKWTSKIHNKSIYTQKAHSDFEERKYVWFCCTVIYLCSFKQQIESSQIPPNQEVRLKKSKRMKFFHGEFILFLHLRKSIWVSINWQTEQKSIACHGHAKRVNWLMTQHSRARVSDHSELIHTPLTCYFTATLFIPSQTAYSLERKKSSKK